MSNKKNKKTKGTPISLEEFHASVPSPAPSSIQPTSDRIDWAKEMEQLDENEPQPDMHFVESIRSQLPSGTKSSYGSGIDLEQVPKQAPFTAYISNVSFEADDEKIRDFFRNSKVKDVRLIVIEGRFKGYGYVEFEDRDSLIEALNKNDTPFNNRPMKVSLSESKGQDGGRGRGGDMGPQKSDEASWRHATPPPDDQPEQSSRGGYNRYQDQQSGYQNRGGSNRYQNNNRDYNNSGGNQYQNDSRGGYQSRGGYNRERGAGGGNWSNRDQDSNRRPYSNYGAGGREGGRNYNDYNDNRRQRMSNEDHQTFERQPPPPVSESSSAHQETHRDEQHQQHAAAPTAPVLTERPRVTINPRTIPVEQASDSSQVAASSIFGAAKPVNTAAREREIEERLKEQKQRAEAAQQAERQKRTSTGVSESESRPDTVVADEEQTNSSLNHEQPQSSTDKQVRHPSESHSQNSNQQRRIHKSSTTSDDSHHQRHDQEFQTVGGRRQNTNKTSDHRSNQRGSANTSYTSPPHSGHSSANNSYNNHPKSNEKPRDHGDSQSSNAWKTSNRSSADLFNSNADHHQNDQQYSRSNNNTQRRNDYQSNRGSHRGGGQVSNDKPRQYGSGYDKNKPMGRGGAREGGLSTRGNDRPKGTYQPREPRDIGQDFRQEPAQEQIGFNNKFANLQVDVDDTEDLE